MKKFIIATGLLVATSAYAQTEVLTGVTRGKDYGVVYALPKTQIEIEIKANKVNYKPGEFSKYADRYLRLTNVSAEPEEYWELNSVKVKPVGVPNSEATYFVNRTLRWVQRQVAPTLKMLKKIDKGNGTDYMETIEKQAVLSEKHEMIIKQQTTPAKDLVESKYRKMHLSNQSMSPTAVTMQRMQQTMPLLPNEKPIPATFSQKKF